MLMPDNIPDTRVDEVKARRAVGASLLDNCDRRSAVRVAAAIKRALMPCFIIIDRAGPT